MSALKYRENDPGVADLRRCYNEGSNSEKREMPQQYLQDKSLKWRFDVIDKTEFKETATDRSMYEWMTEAAIAAKEGLNRQQEEDKKVLAVILKQYEQRPHENEELAAMNMKQYKVLKEQKILDNATHQTTGCSRSVTGNFVERPSGSKQNPLKRNQPDTTAVVVDWTVPFRKLKTACTENLKQVEKLLNLAQKKRSAADEAKKSELREGTRMLQTAADALEDSMTALDVTEDDAKKCDEDHQKLKTLNTQMAGSVEAFEKLLYECVPKLKKSEKEE